MIILYMSSACIFIQVLKTEKNMKNNNLIAITVDVEDNKLHSDFNYTNVINALKYSQKTTFYNQVFNKDVELTLFMSY